MGEKKGISKEEARAELERRASEVSERDLTEVVEKAEEIEKKVERGSVLRQQLDKVRLLLMLVKDFWRKEYRDIDWFYIAIAVAALIYVLSPIDLIPDFIPVAGQMDDVAVLLVAWEIISREVCKYAKWKAQRDERAAELYRSACS
jgi:uncharacterized membrane protein YkvA (DUF1232 family)